MFRLIKGELFPVFYMDLLPADPMLGIKIINETAVVYDDDETTKVGYCDIIGIKIGLLFLTIVFQETRA